MAALGNTISLDRGRPNKINTAGIAGAGTIDFIVPPRSSSDDFTTTFHAVPGGGALTTLTAALQVVEPDGTATDLVASANFISTGANSLKQIAAIPAGALLRVNITAASGGFDIYVTPN